MEKTLFIFIAATDGGALGFTADGRWARVTTANRRAPEELKGFACLDRLSLALVDDAHSPALIGDKIYAGGVEKAGEITLDELAKMRTVTAGGRIFGTTGKTVSANDFAKLKSVYALLYVTEFSAGKTSLFGGAPARCSFNYNGTRYEDFVLADPDFRDGENECAFVAVGLVPDALKEGRFIKTAHRIIALPQGYSVNTAYGGDYAQLVTFYKEGYFFAAFDGDAVLLNGLFGYKLAAGNRAKTGVPAAGARTVAARLADKGIRAIFRDECGRETDVESISRNKPVKEKAPERKGGAENELTKMYIDLILNGINPVTMREIPESDVTRQPEVMKRLAFLSEMLAGG